MTVRSLCLALVALLGCAPDAPPDPRPLVVVSVLPQKYLVDRIAGDRVRGEVMIPPGASPTTHAPTLAQLRALSEASLYVKVGHPGFAFERAWLDAMLRETPELPVVDGAAGTLQPDGDPHVWVAPQQMERMAVQVEAALAEILPEDRALLAANLAAFREEVRALDAEIRAALAGKRGRRFFVLHPAWGAFAAAYDLEQVAIEQEHKSPDARQLALLIARARAEHAKVIFVQPQFDPSSAETLAREIGARVVPLDPLAYDWPANLRRVSRAIAEGLPE